MGKVSETRMVDIQPNELYEELRNVAANGWVNTKGDYSGSYEALALKQAFTLGANTSAQFPGSHVKLLQAVMAGRKWGLHKTSSRRLVVAGKIRAGFPTMEMTIDSSDDDTVAAAGLPQWRPQHPPETEPEPEPDGWCREESCEYRNWRSGSMPTHMRGPSCPSPDHDLKRKQEIEDGGDL